MSLRTIIDSPFRSPRMAVVCVEAAFAVAHDTSPVLPCTQRREPCTGERR